MSSGRNHVCFSVFFVCLWLFLRTIGLWALTTVHDTTTTLTTGTVHIIIKDTRTVLKGQSSQRTVVTNFSDPSPEKNDRFAAAGVPTGGGPAGENSLGVVDGAQDQDSDPCGMRSIPSLRRTWESAWSDFLGASISAGASSGHSSAGATEELFKNNLRVPITIPKCLHVLLLGPMFTEGDPERWQQLESCPSSTNVSTNREERPRVPADLVPRYSEFCRVNRGWHLRVWSEIGIENLLASSAARARLQQAANSLADFFLESSSNSSSPSNHHEDDVTVLSQRLTTAPYMLLKSWHLINPAYAAARSDFARLVVLFLHGGVYFDAKSGSAVFQGGAFNGEPDCVTPLSHPRSASQLDFSGPSGYKSVLEEACKAYWGRSSVFRGHNLKFFTGDFFGNENQKMKTQKKPPLPPPLIRQAPLSSWVDVEKDRFLTADMLGPRGQWFLASIAGHPFLHALLQAVVRNIQDEYPKRCPKQSLDVIWERSLNDAKWCPSFSELAYSSGIPGCNCDSIVDSAVAGDFLGCRHPNLSNNTSTKNAKTKKLSGGPVKAEDRRLCHQQCLCTGQFAPYWLTGPFVFDKVLPNHPLYKLKNDKNSTTKWWRTVPTLNSRCQESPWFVQHWHWMSEKACSDRMGPEFRRTGPVYSLFRRPRDARASATTAATTESQHYSATKLPIVSTTTT